MIETMSHTRMRLRNCARAAAFAASAALGLGLAAPAHAQYMSCESFLDLDDNLRHLYLTGFVEGLTYTQLELVQLVNAQSENKELAEGQKVALTVMARVAENIGQGVPAGFTVAQVADKLKEMCSPDENKKAAFVNIYSEYSLALRQTLRMRQQQEGGKAAQGAAPAGGAKPAAKKPAAAPAPGTGEPKPDAAENPAQKPDAPVGDAPVPPADAPAEPKASQPPQKYEPKLPVIP
jgi:hypothetical protein